MFARNVGDIYETILYGNFIFMDFTMVYRPICQQDQHQQKNPIGHYLIECSFWLRSLQREKWERNRYHHQIIIDQVTSEKANRAAFYQYRVQAHKKH